MKETHSDQLMEMSWVQLLEKDLEHLKEKRLESQKAMSSAYKWDSLMATKMALLTESCWVLPMERGLGQRMEMLKGRSLVHLRAVRMAMQKALPTDVD